MSGLCFAHFRSPCSIMDSITACHKCGQSGFPFPAPLWPQTINVYQCSSQACFTIWGKCHVCSSTGGGNNTKTQYMHMTSRKLATQHCNSRMHRASELIKESRLSSMNTGAADNSPITGCHLPNKKQKPCTLVSGSHPWSKEISNMVPGDPKSTVIQV